MRIPRPRLRKPQFRRKTLPPPAARKLLLASMSSGLVLIVALAIVFIPQGLFYEQFPPIPRITLALNQTGGDRLVVTRVTILRPIAEFGANFSHDTTEIGEIDPLAEGAGTLSFSFDDADLDGHLSVGDAFGIDFNPGADNVLRVWWKSRDTIVGGWPIR